MSKRPTVLMILDGYGLNDRCDHNAVCEGKTPVMDQLMSQCPFVKGNASGLFVGLPDGLPVPVRGHDAALSGGCLRRSGRCRLPL